MRNDHMSLAMTKTNLRSILEGALTRKTGIKVIGDAPWGTHFCQFYQTKQDLVDILVPYFKAGLEHNEFCMWITSEPLRVDEAFKALQRKIRNLDEYVKKGQIEILDSTQWYTKSGKFDSKEVLDGWISKEKQAIKKGFSGLRLTGNTFWLEKKDWNDFTDYEAIVNQVIGHHRMIALCSYCLDKCNASEIIDVVSNHQFALIKKEGAWEIIESMEHKKVMDEVKKNEEKYRTLFETTTQGVVYQDSKGKIISANPAAERILGLTIDQMQGRTSHDPRWRASNRDGMPLPGLSHPSMIALRTGKPVMDTLMKVFNPETKLYRWINVNAIPQFQEGAKKPYMVYTTFEDITERKLAQEALKHSEERLRKLYVSMNEGICQHQVIYNRSGKAVDYKILEINPMYEKLTGQRKKDIIGKMASDIYHMKKPPYLDIYAKVVQTGKPVSFETYFPPMKKHFSISVFSPEPGKFATVFFDITERKKFEQEQERKTELLRQVQDGVIGTDQNFRITYWNEGAEKMFGYRETVALGKTTRNLLRPTYAREERKEIINVLATEGTSRAVVHLKHKKGTDIVAEVTSTRITDESGNITGYVILYRDVTEKQKVEIALRNAEMKYRTVADNTYDFEFWRNPEGEYLYASPSCKRITGYTAEDFLSSPSLEQHLVHPDDASEFHNHLIHERKNKKPGELEFRIIHKDGSIRWIHHVCQPLHNEKGTYLGIRGSNRDITDKKIMENALRQSEEWLRRAQSNAHVGVWDWDLINQSIQLTPEFEILYGLKPGTIKEYKDWARLVHPDDRMHMENERDEAIEKHHLFDITFRIMHPSGEIRWMNARGGAIYDKQRNPIRVYGINIDITEQKKIEGRIQEERDQLLNLFNSMEDGVYICSADNEIEYINPALEKEFGPVNNRKCYTYFHGFSQSCPWCKKDEVFSGKTIRWEWYIPQLHKTYDVLETPIKNEKGGVSKLKIMRDITERKKMEIALKRSEERYVLAQRAASIGSWDLNLLTNDLEWSDEIEPMFGFKRGGFDKTYEKFLQCVYPDDRQFVTDSVNASIKEGRTYDIEHRIVWPDGSIHWMSETGDVIRDKGGKAIRMIGVVQDITERKLTEMALKTSEENARFQAANLQALLDAAPAIIWIGHDKESRVITGNRASNDLLRVPISSNVSKSNLSNSHLDHYKVLKDGKELMPQEMPIQYVAASGTPLTGYGFDIAFDDGTMRSLLGNVSPVFDLKGNPDGAVGVFMDITERKRAGEELRETRDYLESLLNYASAPIIVWDADFKIVRFNHAFERLTGYSQDEVVSKKLDLLFPRASKKESLDKIKRTLAGEFWESMEIPILRKDGKSRITLWNSANIYDRATNSLRATIAQGLDITERIQIETTLKESEKKYRDLIKYAPAGIYEVDFRTNRFLTVNDVMCQMSGYTREELLRMNPINILDDESKVLFQRRISQWLANEKPDENVEYKIKTKDGRIIHVLLNVTFTSNVAGKPKGATVVGYDITERKQLEEKIRDTAEKYSSLFNTTSDGVSIQNLEGRILEVNEAYCQMSGYTQEEIIGMNISSLEATESPEEIKERIKKLVKGGGHDRFESRHRRKDGSLFDVDISALYLERAGGQIAIFVRDITERKKIEQTLYELNEKLLNHANALSVANKELEAFSYSVSHDLRAPLRSIDGFSQALLEDYTEKLDDQGKDYLQRVRKATQRMGQLIDDMLRLSRVSRADLAIENVDLSDLAKGVGEKLRTLYPSQSVNFKIKSGLMVKGDKKLLEILLENLIGNAWKFTSHTQHPHVEIGTIKKDNEQIFYVRDNGAGFDMAYLDKLFIPFQRLHSIDEYPGTGIGLAIVSRIVHRHGGRIWAEGKIGEGATLYFTLQKEVK